MENTSYITLSRQTVLRRQMDVLANNLANISTPAFKSEAMLVVEHDSPIATQGPKNMRTVAFVKDFATVRDMSEGPLFHTDNPLDMAISGPGYFSIKTPDGERFTRQGAFLLNGKGELVTMAGQQVLDDRGRAIVVPPGSGEVEVAHDGTISARDPQLQTQNVVLARLKISQFDNEYMLKREANGLYKPDQGVTAKPVAQPKVMQGMIEKSNVNGIVEMTKLIDTVRSFQSAGNLMEEEHNRQLKAIDTLTKSNLTA